MKNIAKGKKQDMAKQPSNNFIASLHKRWKILVVGALFFRKVQFCSQMVFTVTQLFFNDDI